MFKRFALAVTAFTVVMAVFAGQALADHPHFVGTPTLTVSGNTLTVSFKAAGLGTISSANFSLTGTVTVSSRCYTKSNNKPQAANKQETLPINDSDTFPVRNGQTTGSFKVSPLSSLSCPPGQKVVIESVTWDLTLSGEGLSFHFEGHIP